MKLYIDSRNNTELILKLNDQVKTLSYESPREQDILQSIEAFLNENEKSLTDLTSIQVETGPGKFTSLRLGIAIANSLAYALNIPINGQLAGTTIEAEYGQPASITSQKK